MPATTERSIAQHINNFKIVIDNCSMFGAQYNPSNPLLTIPSMNSSWSNTITLHETYTGLLMASKHHVNARQALFRSAILIVTRSYNYYLSTTASDAAKRDAKSIADRLRGHGVKIPKLPDGTKDPNHISNSHQGFSSRTEAMRELAAFYAADPNYAPNEPQLQASALLALADQMQATNNQLSQVIAPVTAARIDRDHALNHKNTGLYTLVKAVKKYVKAVFGPSSPEYRSISGIDFRK